LRHAQNPVANGDELDFADVKGQEFSFTFIGIRVIGVSARLEETPHQLARAKVNRRIEETNVNALTNLSPAYYRGAWHSPVLAAC